MPTGSAVASDEVATTTEPRWWGTEIPPWIVPPAAADCHQIASFALIAAA
jgi:hypothetical protein